MRPGLPLRATFRLGFLQQSKGRPHMPGTTTLHQQHVRATVADQVKDTATSKQLSPTATRSKTSSKLSLRRAREDRNDSPPTTLATSQAAAATCWHPRTQVGCLQPAREPPLGCNR